MFKIKIFISILTFSILLIVTSIIKNQTREIEKKIFNLSKVIKIKEKDLNESQLDFSYLSSPFIIHNKIKLIDKEKYVKQIIPKYSLTKGINEKKYRLISEQVINNLPDVEEWYDKDFLKKNNFLNWNENIIALHKTKDSQNNLSKTYKRLVFDEIFANFLVLSENRKKIKIKKKRVSI